MISLLAIAIITRAYSSGGIYAPGFFSIALIPVLGIVFFGARWGWILMILSVGLVLLVLNTNINKVIETPLMLALSIISVALLIFIPTVILHIELKKLNNEVIAVERSKSSLLTLSRLAHEINNPLYVVFGFVEINKDNISEIDFQTILRNIKAISKTIKIMSTYAEKHSLADALEKHKNIIHICDVLNDDSDATPTNIRKQVSFVDKINQPGQP